MSGIVGVDQACCRSGAAAGVVAVAAARSRWIRYANGPIVPSVSVSATKGQYDRSRLRASAAISSASELENTLERGIALARADTIEMDDLLLDSAALSDEAQPGDPASAASSAQNLHDFLESAAEERIRGVLAATAGKRVEAARRLGIDRTTLYRLIRKYGIEHAN